MEELELLNIIKYLDNQEKEKVNYIIKTISNFNKEKRSDALKNIITYALLKVQSLDNEPKKSKCESEGHLFGEWELANLSDDENESFNYWKRVCSRCRVIDVSSKDPNMIEKGKNK